jgi:hypothetical protein
MSWMRGTWSGTTTNSGSLYFEKVNINPPNIMLSLGSSVSIAPNAPATGRYVARLSLACAGANVELNLAHQRAAQPFTNLKTWTGQGGMSPNTNTPAVFEHVVDLVAGTSSSSASDDLKWSLVRGSCSYKGLTLTAQ